MADRGIREAGYIYILPSVPMFERVLKNDLKLGIGIYIQ